MRDTLVNVLKPIIISIATHPAVKQLVVELLEKYVNSTDNSIDNAILALVKEKMFKPQE